MLLNRRESRAVLIGPDNRPNADGWRLIGQMLRRRMPTKERPGGVSKNGKQLPSMSYITARQVQARLDEVVGPGNWSTSYFAHGNGAVECTLSIYGVSKTDVGYSNNPDRDDESEPLKAAYSDAFKRAAVAWGIGRFLYGDPGVE